MEIYILASCLDIMSHPLPIQPLCFPDHLSHCFLFKLPENSSGSADLLLFYLIFDTWFISSKLHSVNLILVAIEFYYLLSA